MLVTIIYLAFISLGLPDSLLGSAWPVMYISFDVPLSYAGIISMIIACGTVISSLMADWLASKLSPGKITAISVATTAIALWGFSVSNAFFWLVLWAIPYGLGAGAVDAALNNYVATHFSTRHMSWLHCFWGVGATISPYIMSSYLAKNYNWQGGYKCVSVIQIGLSVLLFSTLFLWKRKEEASGESLPVHIPLNKAIKAKGVIFVLISFFFYCGLESTTGLWAASYLNQYRNVSPETAATFSSLFYIGITLGRFLSGFISQKLGDRKMIRYGTIILLAGMLCVAFPVSSPIPALVGLVIIGLGCAPIYPSIIHATPSNFGKEYSQAIIGLQMASAYIGTTFVPPVFGWIAQKTTLGLYPFYLLIFGAGLLLMTEWLTKKVSKPLAKI